MTNRCGKCPPATDAQAMASATTAKTDDSTRTLTARTGIVAVVVIACGLALVGTPPGVADTPNRISAFYAYHRARILVGSWLGDLGVALLLPFLAGLRSWLRRREPATTLLCDIGLIAGVSVFSVAIAASVFAAELAYRSGSDPATARTLNDTYVLLINISAFPTVISAGAFAVVLIRTCRPARWAGWLSAVVAVAHLLASASLARSGAFSPTGVFPILAPLSYLAWVVATSALLLGRREI
jgi:hypothetical protein